jgi:hypothetical protein
MDLHTSAIIVKAPPSGNVKSRMMDTETIKISNTKEISLKYFAPITNIRETYNNK